MFTGIGFVLLQEKVKKEKIGKTIERREHLKNELLFVADSFLFWLASFLLLRFLSFRLFALQTSLKIFQQRKGS